MGTSTNREMTQLEKSFEQHRDKLERAAYSVPAAPFKDNSETARNKRVKKAMKDFLYFDKTYFPSEYHKQGWFPPGYLHFKMLEVADSPGIHWFGAFRNLAKTVYLKKLRIWYLLSGRATTGAIMSETKTKSRMFVRTIEAVLRENQRIVSDFDINIEVMNDDMLRFTCNYHKGLIHYLPYSPASNARGSNPTLDRPDFMDFDDLETNRKVFDEANNHKLLLQIREAYRSCKDNATMIGLGNDLHPKCLYNKLKIAAEKGGRSDLIHIYAFKAWSDKRTDMTPYTGSVWEKKYPAKSESEMRELVNADDDVEWAEAQCDPIMKSGKWFPPEFAKFYTEDELPKDAKGVGFCDPNLSEKDKGDTTAFGSLLYSRNNNNFYFRDLRCKSYSDSDTLLMDYLTIFSSTVPILAMDGNVNQQSIWKNNIRNFVRVHSLPFPHIDFCRYNVDDIVTPFSALYKQGRVYFPKEFCESEEGQEFMSQLYSFTSKKANKKDDAPDFCISAYMFGMEKKRFIATSNGGTPYFHKSVGFSGGW